MVSEHVVFQLRKSILTVASGLNLFFPYKKGEAIGYLKLFVAHEISGVMNDHDSNPKNATVFLKPIRQKNHRHVA